MRRIIVGLLLAATAATPLLAQPGPDRPPRGEDRDRGPRDERPRDDRGPPDRRDDAPHPDRFDPRSSDPRYGNAGIDPRGGRPDIGLPPGGPDPRGWRDDDRRGGDSRWREAGRGDDRWQRDRDDRSAGWSRDWRVDRRYDWQSYRSRNRGLYTAPRYYAPRGGGYRRWSPGYRVAPAFYDRGYWIGDPYRYRLPPADGPYRWVRYYDDVALVDIRSGLIADIVYGFFS